MSETAKRLTLREQNDRLSMALSRARAGLQALGNSQGWAHCQRQSIMNGTLRMMERIMRGEPEGNIDYPDANGYEWENGGE